MKSYTLQRFVKLNLYFFAMYSLLTTVWYTLTGGFEAGTGSVLEEIAFNAAVFSLLFSLAILLWYRRAAVRLPAKRVSAEALRAQLEQLGFLPVSGPGQAAQVYKPAPPKAPALAGKVFVQQKEGFYLVEGPAKYVGQLKA